MSETTIILSPGRANPDGRFADYGDDGSYIGGQIRMDAAVDMMRKRPDDVFLLVGGCDVETLWTPHSDKAMDMSRFICRTLQEEEPDAWQRVYDLASLPCTYHNFVAALHALNTGTRFMEPGVANIDVLTNAYHIPRSQLHAEQAKRDVFARDRDIQADITFTWHAAERVLGRRLVDVRNNNPAAYQRRLDMESNGLTHIDRGFYRDSCRNKYKGRITQLLVSHGTRLLAPHEFEQWGIYAHL